MFPPENLYSLLRKWEKFDDLDDLRNNVIEQLVIIKDVNNEWEIDSFFTKEYNIETLKKLQVENILEINHLAEMYRQTKNERIMKSMFYLLNKLAGLYDTNSAHTEEYSGNELDDYRKLGRLLGLFGGAQICANEKYPTSIYKDISSFLFERHNLGKDLTVDMTIYLREYIRNFMIIKHCYSLRDKNKPKPTAEDIDSINNNITTMLTCMKDEQLFVMIKNIDPVLDEFFNPKFNSDLKAQI